MTASFPLMNASLPERDADRFGRALALLAGYEAEGVLLASEFGDLKSMINRAIETSWRVQISERFTYNGKFESLTEAETALDHAISFPACHLVAGQLRKALASKADGAMRDAMIAALTEFVAVADRVNALKALVGKRAPKPTKTSIAREARAAQAMTCQCCGRPILAEGGLIAHHGYQRPGSGWQTASCFGARELPFEVSREALGRLDAALGASLLALRLEQSELKGEVRPVVWSFDDKAKGRDRLGSWRKTTLSVTRATWAEAHAQYLAARPYRTSGDEQMTFDDRKQRALVRVARSITETEAFRAEVQTRYAAWVATHRAGGEGEPTWVAL